MPTYQYKARDKQGKAVTGIMEGLSEKGIAESLMKMGYIPVNIEAYKEKKKLSLNLNFFARVKDEERVMFSRQIHTILKAGVPLLAGLEACSEQSSSKVFKDVITEMKVDVEGGMSFSETLAKHPKAFDQLSVNMVKAGEASGRLSEAMLRLADLQEYDMQIKSKIKTAMRYPTLAACTLVGAFFVIVTFVIPRFADLFARLNVELPLPTRVLLNIYSIIRNYWLIVIIAVVALVMAFAKFINTEFGRRKWDLVKIKVPILGPLFLKLYMSRFTKTASILIANGINMLQTLSLSADTVGNVVVSDAVKYIREGVNEGKGIAEPMKVSKFFTPIVIQMVSIGEETGKLDELLMSVSDHYDQQVDYEMQNLTTMIEPVFIFLLGMMVLFVALAIFLPMWNMIQAFRG